MGTDAARTGDVDREGCLACSSSGTVVRWTTGELLLALLAVSPRSSSLSLPKCTGGLPSRRSVAHCRTFHPSPSSKPRLR